MTDYRRAFVHEARLRLANGADTAAPGGAVTAALCGHWEHAGVCRWPHNNAIDGDATPMRLRTLFIAEAADEQEVRQRIERALKGSANWTVLSSAALPVTAGERLLAQRLSHTDAT